MSNPITVLMVDDDKDNFSSLKNKAALKGIILKFTDNLEDMVMELKANLNIDAVILDGKGFKKRGQTKGSEKTDFVHEALTELKLLEKEQDRNIPKCVYTAWYDQLKESLESRVRVFDKKKLALDDNLMEDFFAYLHSEVAASGLKKIKEKYKNILDVVGGKYIPDTKEASIIQILSLIESNDSIKQSDFNTLRDIYETILLRANIIDTHFIPGDLIKADGRPNLEWCSRYLSGLLVEVKDSSDKIINTYPKVSTRVPAHIGRSIDYLKNISSILSHGYTESWTSLSYKSAGLALAEILIWFKNHIDKKYPNI